MRLNLSILATAAVLLPTAAIAQSAAPAKPASPPQSTAPGQTGMTPGQQQTTPGQASDLTPATTGTTPSGQTTAKGAGAAAKSTKGDVKAGASVVDSDGNGVGKIESVSGKEAILDTGKVKVSIPVSSLSNGDKGLVIGMTRAQIEAAAKSKTK